MKIAQKYNPRNVDENGNKDDEDGSTGPVQVPIIIEKQTRKGTVGEMRISPVKDSSSNEEIPKAQVPI